MEAFDPAQAQRELVTCIRQPPTITETLKQPSYLRPRQKRDKRWIKVCGQLDQSQGARHAQDLRLEFPTSGLPTIQELSRGGWKRKCRLQPLPRLYLFSAKICFCFHQLWPFRVGVAAERHKPFVVACCLLPIPQPLGSLRSTVKSAVPISCRL